MKSVFLSQIHTLVYQLKLEYNPHAVEHQIVYEKLFVLLVLVERDKLLALVHDRPITYAVRVVRFQLVLDDFADRVVDRLLEAQKGDSLHLDEICETL